MANLANNLCVAAAEVPDRLALKCEELEYTYSQFDCAAARFATLLQSYGVQPGDRVGLMLPNTPAFAIAFYGLMRCGAVAVPMNPLLKSREVEYYLTNTTAVILLAAPSCAGEAQSGAVAADVRCVIIDDESLTEILTGVAAQLNPVACAYDDTAVILHTSGTTGKPKGAQLTHGGLRRNAEIAVHNLTHMDRTDVIMGCLPLFHVFGLTFGLNSVVIAHATLTLLPRFDARTVLSIIARDGVTIFGGVPTMYSALLSVAHRDSDTTSLRLCVSGGAALPVQVLHDFEQSFGATVLEGYGLSETSPIACFSHPHLPRKAGTIGTPVEGVEMRIVDEAGSPVPQGQTGEIQVRGHNVMKGYWNLPEETQAVISPEGWFSTGDIGLVDADGYFTIVDRKKEMIIRGGLNIYPREIEEVLYEHPAIAAAAVIGIPDKLLGEEVGAAIEFKPGMTATTSEVSTFVKERVAGYKYPRRIWVLDALPKNATGKLQKRDIVIPEEFRR